MRVQRQTNKTPETRTRTTPEDDEWDSQIYICCIVKSTVTSPSATHVLQSPRDSWGRSEQVLRKLH